MNGRLPRSVSKGHLTELSRQANCGEVELDEGRRGTDQSN